MPTPNQSPPGKGEAYPSLPGADAVPHPQGGPVERVSFVFPGARVFCHEWDQLVGANYSREAEQPTTIEFIFPAFFAKAVFEGNDPSLHQRCWQDYLCGRLAVVEHRPGQCRLDVRYMDLTVDFDRVWPVRAGAKKRPPRRQEDLFP